MGWDADDERRYRESCAERARLQALCGDGWNDPVLRYPVVYNRCKELFHDFLEGPGELLGFSRAGDIVTREVLDASDLPFFRELTELKRRCHLPISLFGHKPWPEHTEEQSREYVSWEICTPMWSLVPRLQQEYLEQSRHLTLFEQMYLPTQCQMVCGEGRIQEAIASFLRDQHWPYRQALIELMEQAGNPLPCYDAVGVFEPGACSGLWNYGTLKRRSAVTIACEDVLETLAAGIVVAYRGKRLRIVLARDANVNPAEWHLFGAGQRLLTVEETRLPLTPLTKGGNLQVFGQGRSQQTDKVLSPQQEVLLTWTDPADFTVCISLSCPILAFLAGRPALALLEGSCT